MSTNPDTNNLEDVLKKVQKHIIDLKLMDEDEIEVKQTIEWRSSLTDKIAFKKAEKPGKEKAISIPEPKPLETEGLLATITSKLKKFTFSNSN